MIPVMFIIFKNIDIPVVVLWDRFDLKDAGKGWIDMCKTAGSQAMTACMIRSFELVEFLFGIFNGSRGRNSRDDDRQ